jgi:hypothetical protein
MIFQYPKFGSGGAAGVPSSLSLIFLKLHILLPAKRSSDIKEL